MTLNISMPRFGAVKITTLIDECGPNIDKTDVKPEERSLRIALGLTGEDADTFGAMGTSFYESIHPDPDKYKIFYVSQGGSYRDVEDIVAESSDPVKFLTGLVQTIRNIPFVMYDGVVDNGVKGPFQMKGQDISKKLLSSLTIVAKAKGFETELKEAKAAAVQGK